jgi:chaperonin GroEL
MNITDNLYTQQEAREKLMVGINKVAGAVRLTLGAGGANAILEADLSPQHRVTNDGVSVAKSIILADPVENIGANIIKEIANKADKESGDGTTTATVLAQAILNEGMKLTDSPMAIKRSLDECLPLIIKSIDAQKKLITVDEVGAVASISAEDESLGALIQEAYQNITASGIIELDNSNLPETFIEYSEGVRLRFAGYLGEYSTTEPGKAEYKKPAILISKEKITSVDQLTPIVKKLLDDDKEFLVLYVEDIDMSVASRLALTHINSLMKGEKGLKTLIIKAPTLWKDWLYEDFSNGKTFNNLLLSDLGTCEKIICTKDETKLIGTNDISEHIKELETRGEIDDQQLVRANWLNTKVAVIKLGANSDSELSYKRLKAIDAIAASKLALEDGVVPGGGVALRNAAMTMPKTIGGDILRIALTAPIEQIMRNATGLEASVRMYKNDEPTTMGFNAKTHDMVDMWDAQILDPALVVKNSIKNALSVASTVLTAQVVVTLNKQDKQPNQNPYA